MFEFNVKQGYHNDNLRDNVVSGSAGTMGEYNQKVMVRDTISASLTKQQIDKVFDTAEHQADYVVGLYRLAIPNFDKVRQVHGYPIISELTANYIWDKSREFDKFHHPNVISGGIWMNNGFGVDKNLDDWIVNTDNSILEYKD